MVDGDIYLITKAKSGFLAQSACSKCLLPLLAAATFWIPAERPDRIGIASLCGLNMALIAFSIIVSIASVNISRQNGPLPRYTEKICLQGLGRIFCCLHSPDANKITSRERTDTPARRANEEDFSTQWKTVVVVLDRTMLTVAERTDNERLMINIANNVSIPIPGRFGYASPVPPGGGPVQVHFDAELTQILNFDTKRKTINLVIWKTFKWRDARLAWEPSDYGGIDAISLPPDSMWTPDIMLYNGETNSVTTQTNLVLSNDGSIVWVPTMEFSSPCEANTTNFPYDTAHCKFKFGPWSNSIDQMTLNTSEMGFNQSEYIESSTWQLVNTTSNLTQNNYDCCKQPFDSITYYIRLRRKPDFLVKVLLWPVVILPLLGAATFWIPPDRPDRIGVATSLCAAFFLLLLLNADYTPPEADSNLASLCGLNMMMIGMAILVSIYSVNLSRKRGPMSRCVKKIFLHGFGRLMGLWPTITVDSKVTSLSLQGERITDVASQKDHTAEWKALSIIFDRLMFVLYLIGIITIFVILFPRPQT